MSCVSSAPEEGRGRSGALTWSVLASILAVHLLVSTRSVAPSSLASPEPFYADDYALHVARAAIIAGQLPHTGRLWVYDPTLMAGYPLGATVFDLDNVGTAVLMALLEPLGPPVAFKLVVWLCLALAPVAVWLGARQLGTTSAEAVTAAAPATVVAASAITFRLGMFANFGACYLAILVVALANRYLARPGLGSFLALVVVSAVGLFLHVFLAILVLVPCALLVLGHAVRDPRPALLRAAAVALALVIVNAVWLVPFLRFAPVLGWDYPHHFFRTGSLIGAWRTLTVLSGWHAWLLGLGAAGFATWARRVGAPLAIAYAVWVVVLLLAGLQGSRIPFLGRFEPAHLVLPLAFALCPLAGAGALALARRGLPLLGAGPQAAVAVAPLLFAPHLLVTLRAVASLPPVAATLPPEGHEFVAWLREHTDRGARILIEDRLHLERPPLDRDVPSHPYFGGHLPALLPQLLDRETIGGPYPEMPIRPHRADFASARFFGEELAGWPPDRFAAQLERYNIGWIVAWSAPARAYLESQPQVVEPIGGVGRFRVFRSRHRPSFFLLGSGHVEARYDALEVSDASPGRIVLKYHWYPGFCSDPPLPVVAFHAADLAMPFLAVDNGTTRHFTLRPTRGWLGRCR